MSRTARRCERTSTPMPTSMRSERGKIRRAIVVGGGVAGMTAAVRLADAGVPVLLLSRSEERRAPSVVRQDGITACGGEQDSWQHLAATLAAGSYFAHQPPVAELVRRAPGMVEELCAAGVPFERARDGRLYGRRCEGVSGRHTYCAGTLTGRHVVRTLAEQLLRRTDGDLRDSRGLIVPGERSVERLIGWNLVDLVEDDRGAVIGVVAEELATGKIRAFAGDAVCLATGGAGALFGAHPGLGSTVAGAAVALRHGAVFANADLLWIEPTALLAGELPLPIGAAARAAGGRLWVPKKPRDRRAARDIPELEREYLLEGSDTALGVLEPAAVVARRLVALDRERRLPSFDQAWGAARAVAYLDLSHVDPNELGDHLSGVSDLCLTFARSDPRHMPIPVFPMVTGLLGGLWVDYDANDEGHVLPDSPRAQATSVPGLFAAGDVEYQYHGAGALPGNVLSACGVAGALAARGMIAYRDALTRSAFDLPASLFERAERRASERCDALLAQARARDGSASTVFGLQAELSKLMNRAAGLDGEPPGRDELRQELDSLSTQLGSVRVSDASARLNQSALALRDMADRLLVARLVLESSAHRGEGPVRSAASDEPRLVLARYDDQEQTRFVDEFSYECCGRRVELASRIDSRGIALTDRADVGVWTIAASAG